MRLAALFALPLLLACADGLDAPPAGASGGADAGFVAAGGSGQGGAAACVAESFAAEPRPVDLYVMLDQSGSMTTYAGAGKTRWGALTSALETFLALPSAGSLGAGLQYFGLAPPQCDPYCSDMPGCCGVSAFCWSCDTGKCCAESLQCDPAAYQAPEVAIAPIADNGAALLASIDEHDPLDFVGTPTGPALAGALAHVGTWLTDHPDRFAAVMLVTDGEPSGCAQSTVSSVAEIAAAAVAGDPAVPTYVLGIGPVDNLDAIAAAGGTESAYIVEDSQDSAAEVLEALLEIQASLPCSYALPEPPPGEALDLGLINVDFAPTEGADPQTIVHVESASECAPEGWYYDDPAAPTKIVACPATCKAFRESTSGKVSLEVGCTTLVR